RSPVVTEPMHDILGLHTDDYDTTLERLFRDRFDKHLRALRPNAAAPIMRREHDDRWVERVNRPNDPGDCFLLGGQREHDARIQQLVALEICKANAIWPGVER